MTFTDADKTYITQQNISVAQQLLAAFNNSLDERINPLLDQLADLRQMLIKTSAPAASIMLHTEHPVAYRSNDHIKPRGTKNDNTRGTRFCRAVEQHFMRNVVALDLGCSGGGLVFDFLVRGHLAIGLEGSDFSQKSQRAEWRVIGPYLHTCDITKPFELRDRASGGLQAFNVITMWEVLEHIQQDDLPQLFSNIIRHLAGDGLLVGSIALYDDVANGVSYHPTVKPETWWREKFASCGLEFVEPVMFEFNDFCRGSGNGSTDLDFRKNPGMGLHFVARRRS
jgi:SAM-dependent methyltransferase